MLPAKGNKYCAEHLCFQEDHFDVTKKVCYAKIEGLSSGMGAYYGGPDKAAKPQSRSRF